MLPDLRGMLRAVGPVTACLAVMAACDGGRERKETSAMDPAFKTSMASLQTAKVIFGHQSVGSDILRELSNAAAEAGIPDLRIQRVKPGDSIVPGINHASIGENTLPASKIEAFEEFVNRAKGDVEIAAMKFCYVDFSAQTDVRAVMESYAAMAQRMRATHPQVVFVHVTVPLKADEGLKGSLKKLLRRGDPNLDNIRRNEFNDLLLERFKAEVIFDLAKVESTRPDGRRETFTAGGKSYYRLCPEYTDDGGHLNKAGGRAAAGALVQALAKAAQLKQQSTRDPEQ